MLALVVAEIGAGLWLRGHVDWWVAAGAALTILLVSAGSGLVAEAPRGEESRRGAVRPGRASAEALLRALVEGEFEAHYQPILSLETGRIAGVEAFVRWRHPEAGLLHPGVFLPTAFDAGFGLDIGNWLVDRALVDLPALEAALGEEEELFVSANLSTPQCADPDRVGEAVADTLAARELPGQRLRFEVAERAQFAAVPVIDRLSALGCPVVIEGFGSERETVRHLGALEVEGVKIEPALTVRLVEDEGARRVLLRTARRARRHGLSVEVSGVETPEQLRVVRRAGAGRVQGFLFGRPLPLAELESGARIRERLGTAFG